MALILRDRVQETTVTTGTGTVTLDGAVTGYQSFAAVGNGNTTFYCIAGQGTSEWEVGIGTYTSSGTTLSRDTVLASSNSGSLVTFSSGTKAVFVTYPSEKSVNLDSSGNVSALGNVTSGTWQGTTVAVAYGGTGVTASSGANSVVLRDADQNISVNSVTQNLTKVTSAGGTTTLTAASSHFQVLTGSTTQTFKLPDATSLPTGSTWVFDNDSTGNLTVTDYANGSVDVVAPGGYATVVLEANGTVAGEWLRYGMVPSEVNWGTNSLDLGGSTVITNGVWQGTAIATGYGGTGLTGFGSANYALYSTSSSALTAGTLPVAAGGTGVTSSTGSGSVVLSNSPTLVTPALGTPSSGNLANCTGYPAGSISGIVAIANGGTGANTASAAFNALSPITTTGDLIIGNGTNSATRLGIGAADTFLKSNGTTASWGSITGGTVITNTAFTATSGQTTFTVNYTVGLIEVFRNGVCLVPTTDYTASNGTTVVLATGATTGDSILVVAFSPINTYANITTDYFNGTGSQTAFTMSVAPADASSTLVTISGVVQDPSSYTVSGTTLTFGVAPPSGSSNITARYLGVPSISSVSSFSGGTTGLTPSTATSGAVVLAGTLGTANGGTGLTTVGTNGQAIISNGTTLSWGNVDSLPTQSGHAGEYLTTNGTAASWSAINVNKTSYGLYENNATIAADYTISSGNNAMSSGPITINSGVSVTVPTGSNWVIL
jgi:hypothetical protein